MAVKTPTDIKNELGITGNETFDELLVLAGEYNVFSQQEINRIKALSVLPLPNKVTNQADELKARFTNIVLNDNNSAIHSINVRNIILLELIGKLVDEIKSHATSITNLDSSKQDEINAQNKLSSDFVSDTNATNKFVTSSEKEQITINATAISNIKDGANLDSFADVENAFNNIENLIYGNSVTLSGASGTLTSAQLAVLTNGNYKDPVILYEDNDGRVHRFDLLTRENLSNEFLFRNTIFETSTNILENATIYIDKSTGYWEFQYETETYVPKTTFDNAKSDLQYQIDGINAGQNLADIVADLTALGNLDTTELQSGDKVQVLVDSNHDNASTVYSLSISGSTHSWTYIGRYGLGVGYTKSEVDTLLATKQNVINANNKLSSDYVDFNLTSSDIDDLYDESFTETEVSVNGNNITFTNDVIVSENDDITINADSTFGTNNAIYL